MYSSGRWLLKHGMVSNRVYGEPKYLPDVFEKFAGRQSNLDIPYPNDNTREALEYWLPYSDFYSFDECLIYDSFEEMYEILENTDFNAVSQRMAIRNEKERNRILVMWDLVMRKMAPHRDRSEFMNKLDMDYDEVITDIKEREAIMHERIILLQGNANKCNIHKNCQKNHEHVYSLRNESSFYIQLANPSSS